MLALRSCSKALAGRLLASEHELGAAHRVIPPTHDWQALPQLTNADREREWPPQGHQ